MQKIKETLAKSGAAPLKKLGQNFLVSKAILSKIIATAELKPSDIVLEIGPGLGFLTFELAKKAKKVVAVEKDRKIAQILEQKLRESNVKNIKVINDDIFNFQFSQLAPPHPSAPSRGVGRKRAIFQFFNYKLVANLPYNIATAVVMKFLESSGPPELMVVMVQKEVGQRICARPPKMNKLAIFCQLYSTIKIVAYVSPSAFWPKPKVDSAILQLKPKEPSAFGDRRRSVPSANTFQKIVNAGFSHPRKTLLNNLVRGLPSYTAVRGQPSVMSKEEVIKWLLKNNIQPNQRPETLSVENWLTLAKNLKTFHNE